ncbi:MAG: hypothetical protein AB7L71_17105 [Vicinamibacterales bacterium]
MSDRTTILLCALAGAVLGGAAGYLMFTEDGRRLRDDLEPRLTDLVTEFEKARAALAPEPAARADVRPFGR